MHIALSNTKKLGLVLGAISFTLLSAGCGGNSNSASPENAEDTPASSESQAGPGVSSATVPASSGATVASSATAVDNSSSSTVVPESSAAVEDGPFVDPATSTYVPPTNPEDLLYTIDPTLAVTPDSNGFYYVADIYKALPATSKVVFVLRHSERGASEGQESQLTENGVQMAQKLGADMVSDESFFYASTDFIRTRETCNNIAIGRGETGFHTYTWSGINGGYFVKVPTDELDTLLKKRGGSWKNLSQWAYGATITNRFVANVIDDFMYDLFERGHRFVNEVVLRNLPGWKRVNFLVSHDILLEALAVYATNRQIDLKFYDGGKWINYMAGIAVVVNEAGAVSLFPVRGADLGWMYYVKQEE